MSGGHFNYVQSSIEMEADEIDNLIEENEDDSKDEFGEARGNFFPAEVISRFKEASHTLKQAAEMLERVDFLVCYDDGEESFLERWEKEVRPYWKGKKDDRP